MNKRIDYIDIAKGIGIVCVVLGHTIGRGILWNIIYGFHMPLFIFFSGVFHKNDKIKSREIRLGMDYIVLSLFAIFVWGMLVEKGNLAYVKQSIFNVFVGGVAPSHGIFPVESLWFIPCLMMIIIVYSIVNLIESDWFKVIVILLSIILGGMLSGLRIEHNVWYSLDVSLMLLPFYAVGNYVGNRNIKLGGIFKPYFFPLIFLGFITTCWMNGYVNVYKGIYGLNYILFIISGFLGIVIVAHISENYIQHLILLKKFLVSLGKNSLIIMGTHQMVIFFCRKYDLYVVQNVVMLFFVSLILSWAFSIAVNSIKENILGHFFERGEKSGSKV